jgi:hypothetical protein
MKRALTAVAALVGVLAAVFIAAPPALAYRDTGWYYNTCPASNPSSTIYIYIRVEWFDGDNHRRVHENTYIKNSDGSITWNHALSAYVKAIGYDWKLMDPTVQNPHNDINYYWDWWPAVNPGQGHYWLARGWDVDTHCDVQVLN